jgi:hypothetical protein
METRPASDVAQLPQNSKQFPEKHFYESEKSSAKHPRTSWRWRKMNLPLRSPKAGVRTLPSIRMC